MVVKAKGLIDEAETFLKAAREEFETAIAKNDMVRIRDSAEKAWNAVVRSTNGLLLALTGKLPLSHYERKVMLRDAERSNLKVRELGVRDRYMARFRVLHGEAFYEGVVDIDELRLELERVEEYINDINEMQRTLEGHKKFGGEGINC